MAHEHYGSSIRVRADSKWANAIADCGHVGQAAVWRTFGLGNGAFVNYESFGVSGPRYDYDAQVTGYGYASMGGNSLS
jgi:hypothetical protein